MVRPPTEKYTVVDMPGLANAFQQLRIPIGAEQYAQNPQPGFGIPDRRGSAMPVYAQAAPPQYPQVARTTATQPGSTPTRLLQTNKAEYEILRSVDPRSKSINSGMSNGGFLIRNTETGFLYVEKRIRITTESKKERALAEIDALMGMQYAGGSSHVNFIIERFWDGITDHCSMILEYCDLGTIDESIKEYADAGRYHSDNFAWHVLTSMTKALCFMHEGLDLDRPNTRRPYWNTICHLDIKPSNVFLSSRNTKGPYPRVVLGDFGCAVSWRDIMAGKEDRATQWQGTIGWHAPEHHVDPNGFGVQGRYGKPTDIWQMGAVVQAMCRRTGHPLQELADQERPCGSRYSGDLNKVVACTMRKENSKRPTALDMVGEVMKQMAKRGLPV